MKIFFILILSLNILNVYSQTADSIRTGRPGQSIGAYVLGTKIFQVQSGIEYNRTKTTSEVESWVNNSVLRYGIDEKWEISTVFDYRYQEGTGSGVDNIQLGGRVNLNDNPEGWVPALCLQARVRLEGSGDFERQETRPVVIMSAVHDLKKAGSLTTNIIYGYDGNTPKPLYSFTLAWGISLTERIGAFVEEYGTYQNDEWVTAIDTGFSYLVHKDLQLDLAFGVDTESNFHQEYVALGFSWRTI